MACAAALAALAGRAQQPVIGRHRPQVGTLIQQRRPHFVRGQVSEPVAVQHVQDRRPPGRGQCPHELDPLGVGPAGARRWRVARSDRRVAPAPGTLAPWADRSRTRVRSPLRQPGSLAPMAAQRRYLRRLPGRVKPPRPCCTCPWLRRASDALSEAQVVQEGPEVAPYELEGRHPASHPDALPLAQALEVLVVPYRRRAVLGHVAHEIDACLPGNDGLEVPVGGCVPVAARAGGRHVRAGRCPVGQAAAPAERATRRSGRHATLQTHRQGRLVMSRGPGCPSQVDSHDVRPSASAASRTATISA